MLNKVAYVVVREDLTSPLIRSQVLDILNKLSAVESREILLVWFYRIDYLFGSAKAISQLKRQLSEEGIDLATVPFLSLKFPVRWFLMPFVLPQWLVGLAWVYFAKKKKIFHCRSYNAGLAAAIFKKFAPVKIVFDPRSPYPEEQVAAGAWSETSLDFRGWKKIEQYVCDNADAIIAISQPFSESLKDGQVNRSVHVIPNNYPNSFSIDARPVSVDERHSSRVSICYVGSFGHWNSPEPYLCLLKYIQENSGIAVEGLFLVPPSCRQFVEDAIIRTGFDAHSITVESASQEDVQDYLKSCDIGMQIMVRADDRLSVKVVEYLASGLPVIVSENVRGASQLVRQENVGFVLDKDQSNIEKVTDFIKEVIQSREEWRHRCVSLAVDRFSPQRVAEQLFDVYRSLNSK